MYMSEKVCQSLFYKALYLHEILNEENLDVLQNIFKNIWINIFQIIVFPNIAIYKFFVCF